MRLAARLILALLVLVPAVEAHGLNLYCPLTGAQMGIYECCCAGTAPTQEYGLDRLEDCCCQVQTTWSLAPISEGTVRLSTVQVDSALLPTVVQAVGSLTFSYLSPPLPVRTPLLPARALFQLHQSYLI